MTQSRVLVTGGAGFIGSHLCRALLRDGHAVRVLDCLSPQIHGSEPEALNWLRAGEIDFVRESVTSRRAWVRSLRDIDVVVHLAAETGTGQSMYEVDRYFQVNVQGTALLLDVLQKGSHPAKALVVASSRAVYGEGAYRCEVHNVVFPEPRSYRRMELGDFEARCPVCDGPVEVTPTEEGAPLRPQSIYGLTKQVQEQAVLLVARTRGLNGFALRYQNVYGPDQSLRNPYTGILGVFSNLARTSQRLEVFEDGAESRDFVFVDDVVEVTRRAIVHREPFVGALNVGTGVGVRISEVAHRVNAFFGGRSEVRTTGVFRVGDIRHNVASTSALQSRLGFVPSVPFREGLARYLSWAREQPCDDSRGIVGALGELRDRGLLGGSSRG